MSFLITAAKIVPATPRSNRMGSVEKKESIDSLKGLLALLVWKSIPSNHLSYSFALKAYAGQISGIKITGARNRAMDLTLLLLWVKTR